MAERARDRDLPGVQVVCGDVLDFQNMEFEAIVCCSVLHEVPSVTAILRRCRELLAPRGRVIVTVPNALSIHRIGCEMSERARQFGVRREHGIEEWHTLLITGTGLKVAERGTFVLKPYPNEQMERLPEEVLDHLARYRGPGGALCWFDLEAA
jgi:2-polyprenyl-3-methyl-5-hydroxy-6-metoxy-1,4-benzoquinol methylase